jgi:hypothetical protein
MDRLEKDGVKLKYILKPISRRFCFRPFRFKQKTGASIVYGPNAKPDFEFISAKDNQVLKLEISK